MAKDQTVTGKAASAGAGKSATGSPDQDRARLTAEVQAARQAEALQVAVAARLRARLFDLTEQMLTVTGGQSAETNEADSPAGDHAERLLAAMADLRTELDDLSAQAELQRSAAGQARAMLAEREAEWQRAAAEARTNGDQDQKAALDTALSKAADDLQAMVQERDHAKALADQRQSEIQSLTAERDELQALRADQKQQLAAREAALARMAEELEQTAEARDEALVLAHQRIAEVRTLTAMVERRLTELETARAKAAEAQELANARQAQIDALLTSTSWRITRPMRAVKSGLRFLRRG